MPLYLSMLTWLIGDLLIEMVAPGLPWPAVILLVLAGWLWAFMRYAAAGDPKRSSE